MRKYYAITMAVILASCLLNAQPVKDVKAELKHVTVFPDRAQADHEGSVTLMPGKSVLKLTELSPYIDPQSVQVKGFGEFTILSVNHQNNYLKNLDEAPEIKSLRSQMEALQLKVEDEKTAIAALKEKEAFLTANRALLVKETTVSVEQIRSIMDLYTNNMEQVGISVVRKNRLIKDYEKQIAAIQQQISEKLVKQNLPSGEVFVTVSSEKQVSGKITLSYVVMNAGWYPSYDIRVTDIRNPVTIFYKANVYQNTGVEWKDVRLSFSNATPWVSGDIPAMYPWMIDFYVQPRMLMSRSNKGIADQAEAPAMMEVAAVTKEARMIEEAPAPPPPVQVQTGETTVTFDVSVPYSIPADGKIQVVEIQRLISDAEYKYVTLPKLSQYAYLTANIADWAKMNLQAGEATLYFENSFVGKTNLDVSQLKDTLAISLGTDNSILVKREKRQDFTSKKVIGANKTETYSFLITVRNNKASGIKLTLQDQIPVSTNSSITVEPVEMSGGKLTNETGEVKWDLELKAQESKQIILSYSVKYPKDKIVILE
ncbi:MAG TPA: DUF4139 domain-containing protein [Bacteroidales bacterium]|nr:DUF4139 domain-containing protein [Bacteroidales bacterium]